MRPLTSLGLLILLALLSCYIPRAFGAETIAIQLAPTQVALHSAANGYSPALCFQLGALKPQAYQVLVWLLETTTGHYYCAATTHCGLIVPVPAGATSVCVAAPLSGVSYTNLLWVGHLMIASSNVNVASAQATATGITTQSLSITPIGSQNGVVGQTMTFSVACTDPAGSTPSYSSIDSPAGLTISATSGSVSYTPNSAGTFYATLSCTRPAPNSIYSSQVVQITVSSPATTTPSATTTTPSATTTTTAASGPRPYLGSPATIPGQVLAENYDLGGEGVAYHDTTPTNLGGAYRTNEAVDLQLSSQPPANNIGWTVTGEWVLYTVNVQTSGAYSVAIQVASAVAGAAFHLELDNVAITASIAVPNTGGWQNWQTLTFTGVQLVAGTHRLKLAIDASNVNILSFSFAMGTATTTPAATTTTPSATTTTPSATTTTPSATTTAAPAGAFVDTVLISGFVDATDYVIGPDGLMWVAEKAGMITVVNLATNAKTQFLNIAPEVHNAGDRGLLTIALDPQFGINNYVYLLYTVAPGTPPNPNADGNTPSFNRLLRYTADANKVAIPSSRTVILDRPDGLYNCGSSHSVGKMRFAVDRSLMWSQGDGGHFEYADGGNDANCVNSGILPASLDVGAFRAQRLDSVNGKILRINPTTGNGMPDNPFYNAAAPRSPQSRIWALGVRNTFRWSFAPTTDGSIVILSAEVGWATWEEVNMVHPGDNMLWPCWEGFNQVPQYFALQPAFCNNNASFAGTMRMPLADWNHFDATKSLPVAGIQGQAVTGAITYTGSLYPRSYSGAIMFCDYALSWVYAGWITGNKLSAWTPISKFTGSVISLDSDPLLSGDLLYINYYAGTIHRISYSTGSPIVAATASPLAGAAPLSVQFSSDGTYSPSNKQLSFLWSFGDGTQSTDANPTHVFSTVGTFTVSLSVQATSGGPSSTASVTITTTSWTPVVSIVQPTVTTYTPPQNVQFVAQTSQSAGPVSLHWSLELIHNSHYHPDTAVSDAVSPTFTLDLGNQPDGTRYSYRIIVTATNAAGISSSADIHMHAVGSQDQAPVASFTATPTTGAAPLTIFFDAHGSFDPDNDFMYFSWNFGDGRLGDQGLGVYHTFSTSGSYPVTLTVTDPYGLSSTATTQIVVRASTTAPPTSPATTTALGSEIGFWRFDDAHGSTAIDSSGNGNTGSLAGNAQWTTGFRASAIAFDGVSAYVSVPASNSLAWPGTTMSVAFFFNLGANQPTQYPRLVSNKQTWNDPSGWEIEWNVAASAFDFINSGGSVVACPATVSSSQWHHLAVVVQGGQAGIYLDAALLCTGPTSANVASNLPITIGARLSGVDSWFLGSLDDVRFFHVALSQSQINSLAAGN